MAATASRVGSAAGRPSTARKTLVADETLFRMFAPQSTPPPGKPASLFSTASQTTATMTDVQFLEALVGTRNQVGVVTAVHAAERQRWLLLGLRYAADLMHEESRHRATIEHSAVEVIAALLQLRQACISQNAPVVAVPACVPPRAVGNRKTSSALLGQTLSPSPSGILDQLDTEINTPTIAPQPAATARGAGSVTSAADSEDVDRLRHRIHLLENRVKSVRQMNQTAASPSPSRAAHVWSAASTKARDQSAPLEKRVEGFRFTERAARAEVEDMERVTWDNIQLQGEVLRLRVALRSATRVMVHAPFNSYRPKIPLKNSLAGEEYLRRWLLVETLQHYEDLLTLAQQHENDKRNAIEDEEEATRLGLFARHFLPYYLEQCRSLETVLSIQRLQAKEQMKKSDALYATLQLRVIVDEEQTVRSVYMKSAMDAMAGLQLLHVELGQVRSVHALAKNLEGQLERQKRRHQEETQYLLTQVPKFGIIHPNGTTLAELHAIATAHTHRSSPVGSGSFSASPSRPSSRPGSGALPHPPKHLSGGSRPLSSARPAVLRSGAEERPDADTGVRVGSTGSYWAGF